LDINAFKATHIENSRHQQIYTTELRKIFK